MIVPRVSSSPLIFQDLFLEELRAGRLPRVDCVVVLVEIPSAGRRMAASHHVYEP